ncbi:(2Fe-2S) ferredoxin domain-containing protein [Varunaivibrio sulfuroxidans]|nr:(2Fe-2S) ferredoxin domain-containing protein [Varunaivibrio sulfuroxidans]WES29764.1 (2Fe-2S) ferredoxin domain-containing protein [Varunaivibrio sulfuroxidans]
MSANETRSGGSAVRTAPSRSSHDTSDDTSDDTAEDSSPRHKSPPFTIRVCVNRRLPPGASCAMRGGAALMELLEREAARQNIAVKVEPSVCMGFCPHGPNIKVIGGALYNRVSPENIPAIVRALTVD